MSQTVLLSLVRRSEGLFAWINNLPDDNAAESISCVALAALPCALYPARDALLADWESLKNATELDAIWPAFWRVFWSTLTEFREQSPVAIPKPVIVAKRPTPTAAHPRAFRGTKFVPPKQPAPIFDLCAWLSEDRLLDNFFARHDFARLPALAPDGQPLAQGSGAAPTVSSLTMSDRWPALTDTFRRLFLWQLRSRPLQELVAWIRIWRGLGNPGDGPALALSTRLCAISPTAHAWTGLALNLAPARQRVFLDLLLAQRAYTLPETALQAAQLIELSALTENDDARFATYLDTLLANLKRQVSAAYTLLGCSLANRRAGADVTQWGLAVSNDCQSVPLEDINRMRRALGGNDGREELAAWEACGRFPGFDQVLRETRWEDISPDAAELWLYIFRYSDWDDEPPRALRRWGARLAVFPDWHHGLTSLSGPWQLKYLLILRNHVEHWEDTDTFALGATHLLPLQMRFCRPPFMSAADGSAVLGPMTRHLRSEGWKQLTALDDRHWLIAERACRRDNDGMLISRGLYSLTQNWPVFAVGAFVATPRRLMRTARLLGCLSYERRRQFLAETARTTWFTTHWERMEPLAACHAIWRLCRETGVTSPLPRRLREHLENGRSLSEQQIARHCRVGLARLPTVLLEALENKIWECIDCRFNLRAHSTAASHAVRLLAGLTARDNRTGLRRFLTAYCQGEAHAHLDHPRNRAWFVQHSRIDPSLWSPREARGHDGEQPEFQITVETDPLEVLMLGTYVGSCLGLGGLCDYSAVACLLDVNKQVLYARNAKGRVLARQLIAIDERDRLVCFDVYPVTAGDALRAAFKAHNAALAQSLGIEMYRNLAGDCYDIPVILAQHWWDDGMSEA
jgi:hypothetical protein